MRQGAQLFFLNMKTKVILIDNGPREFETRVMVMRNVAFI